jgi:gamma-glutamyltranspeptidase/glutathione hydrolase
MRRVQVASATQLAADAGATVADAGGNAVDVAIGASLASMCSEIGIIAPTASGFVSIWPADGDPVVIDANAEMAGRGHPEAAFGSGGRRIEMEYGGHTETIVGWGSIAAPGAFAGFELAHDMFGETSWANVLRPTIDIVERGFPMTRASAEYLGHAHRLIFGWEAESSAIVHHDDGSPLGVGDMVHIPHLAETLHVIAEEGSQALYTGDLGRAISATIIAGGGIVTVEDLEAYRPIIRDPIRFHVDQWDLAANPPPAVGGVAMSAMLLLACHPPFEGWTRDEVRRMAEIQRAVLRYRSGALDSLDTRDGAAAALLELAHEGDLEAVLSSPSTVHTSAVDTDGNACAVTVSAGYGSGAIVPGTGLWMNNSLGEVELIAEGFHALAPGTRMSSNMSPTVARRPDGSVLAVGSPGASRITTALTQVLINFLHLGMSLRESVAHPRMHVEVFAGQPTIAYEPGLPVEGFDGLVARRFPDLAMYFGGVQAALWDPIAGLYGAADPRRSGGIARGGAD